MANVSVNHPAVTPGGNPAHNFIEVTVGELTVWFSYRTPIAYRYAWGATVVRENDWSNTTGRHLAWIDGGDRDAKKARISGEQFTRQLATFEVVCQPAQLDPMATP